MLLEDEAVIEMESGAPGFSGQPQTEACGTIRPGGHGGMPVRDVCRLVGISEQTFYARKKVYGGRPPSEARELGQLGDENTKGPRRSR